MLEPKKPNDWKELEGQTVVFCTITDSGAFDLLNLREGEVELVTQNFVRINGRWFHKSYVRAEVILD